MKKKRISTISNAICICLNMVILYMRFINHVPNKLMLVGLAIGIFGTKALADVYLGAAKKQAICFSVLYIFIIIMIAIS